MVSEGRYVDMSNHHAYQMYAHLTWHTWQRVPCINRPTAIDIDRAILNSARDTGVHVLRKAVLSDHVHLVVSFRPDIRLSDFIRLAKSRSATMANRRVFGAIKWARGSFVTTHHRHDLQGVEHCVSIQYDRHPDRIPKDPTQRGGSPDPGRKPGVNERRSQTG